MSSLEEYAQPQALLSKTQVSGLEVPQAEEAEEEEELLPPLPPLVLLLFPLLLLLILPLPLLTQV